MGGAGSGRKGEGARPSGAQDAGAARAGLNETIQRPGKSGGQKTRPQVTAPPVDPTALTEEEIMGAGLAVQDAFKSIAEVRGRHWDIVEDARVPRVGRPAAMILRKFETTADQYPWFGLLIALGPGLFAAVKFEVDHARAQANARRAARSQTPGVATPTGFERGGVREERGGQNESGAVVIGAALPMPDR
jgi:hypothetical protein